MHPTISGLFERKSVRAFTDQAVSPADRELIIDAAIQAPTAGNQVLYTILHIDDAQLKKEIAITCDNQPFIARAPLVLLFLADCRRWLDTYRCVVPDAREPHLGDLMLAFSDALIAAQNAVTAAHALGIGSCYIGDILEQRERVSELLALDQYVMPATLLVFGYPTAAQLERRKPARFDRRFVVRRNRYQRPSEADLRDMLSERQTRESGGEREFDFDRFVTAFCARKYESAFMREMNGSAREYLEPFL